MPAFFFVTVTYRACLRRFNAMILHFQELIKRTRIRLKFPRHAL